MLECATPPNVMCAGKLSVHAIYGGIIIGLHVRMCACAHVRIVIPDINILFRLATLLSW